MPYLDVDVRTPIFYRQSFASALEKQSSTTYTRLTHTPVIAEHLPRGAASGALIAQYATSHLRRLDELEKLLCTVLDSDAEPKAGASQLHCSTCERGIEEMECTVIAPSVLLHMRPSHTQSSRKDGERKDQSTVFPAGDSLATGGIINANNSGGLSFSTAKKMTSSVSFPADSSSAASHTHRDAANGDPAESESRRVRLWHWVRGWLWRNMNPSTPSKPAMPQQREESGFIGRGSATARSYRREYATSAFTPATTQPQPPQPAQKASSFHVPAWVQAAFTPAAATIAAATVDNTHATLSRVPLRWSSQRTCASAAEESITLARGDTAPVGGGTGVGGGEVGGAYAATGRTAAMTTPNDKNGDCGRSQKDKPLFIDSKREKRAPFTQELSLPLTKADDSWLLWHCRADSETTQGVNVEESAKGSGHTGVPTDSDGQSPLPLFDAHTHANPRATEEDICTPRGQKHKSESPVLPMSTIDTDRASLSSRTQAYAEHNGEGNGDAAASSQSAASRTDTVAADKPHVTSAASSAFLAVHNGVQENRDDPPHPTTQPFAHSRATAGTNVLARWDRHAYAVELVGWLNLLVWVRYQVIYFLRDLSGVQGFVAWSAWYWSWAQEHLWQSSLHEALSSRRFWRGLWMRGLSAQLSEVQYKTSGHMFALKNAFRLVVSYIGEGYTSLEQLNSVITQIQRHCAITTPPMAAAARSCVDGLGVAEFAGMSMSATMSPRVNGSANRGAYSKGRQDFASNPSNLHWGFAPTPAVSDDFSLFAPRTCDGVDNHADVSLDSYAAHSPVSDDANGQDSMNETVMADAAAVEAAAALRVLDELRKAVWSALKEQQSIFRSREQQLDVLESNAIFGLPGDLTHADGRLFGNAPAMQARGNVPMFAESVFNSSTMGEVYPGSPSMRTGDDGRRTAEEKDSDRVITARDGAMALLWSVQHSQRLVQRLKALVQRAHSPPVSRHWQRIVVAAVTTIPPFIWIYRKTPAELLEITRSYYHLARTIMRSYILDPMAQLKESLFYVRPGVEDRRGAFERDAISLANIIRDFHEDMYPNMPVSRLEQMRDRTLDRLRAGVADPEGLGLIDQQYRHSLRHPIRSVIFGDLPRILLIQLSYQALEMSRVANGVDEVLEGNDLNFKIMALLPVFAAGGFLVSWGMFYYRANHKPVRMRMKLLWRSLFRVISFADGGAQVLPPFMRGWSHRVETDARLFSPSRILPKSLAAVGADKEAHATNIHKNRARHDVAGMAPLDTLRKGTEEGHADGVNPASFAEAIEDGNYSFAASVNMPEDAASERQLNNYDQGMVLLLSHVIRSLVSEYLRSYEYFHELLEDLNDLESAQSSRRQRLATLERMRATHTSLF